MSRHAQSDLKLYLKDLRYRHAFWLIIIIIIIIKTSIVFHLTSVKIHINDKTNLKSQSLQVALFTSN